MNLLLPYWIRTVVLTTTLFAFSGLASAGEESGKWLCPEAGYRLRVTPEKADKVGSVDLRRLHGLFGRCVFRCIALRRRVRRRLGARRGVVPVVGAGRIGGCIMDGRIGRNALFFVLFENAALGRIQEICGSDDEQ